MIFYQCSTQKIVQGPQRDLWMFKWLGTECLKWITYEWGGIEAPICLEILIYNVPLLPKLQHGSNNAEVVVGVLFGSLRLTIRAEIWCKRTNLKGPNFKVLSDFQQQNKEGRSCKHAVSSEKALDNARIVNAAVKHPTEMQIIPWLVEYHNSDESPMASGQTAL